MGMTRATRIPRGAARPARTVRTVARRYAAVAKTGRRVEHGVPPCPRVAPDRPDWRADDAPLPGEVALLTRGMRKTFRDRPCLRARLRFKPPSCQPVEASRPDPSSAPSVMSRHVLPMAACGCYPSPRSAHVSRHRSDSRRGARIPPSFRAKSRNLSAIRFRDPSASRSALPSVRPGARWAAVGGGGRLPARRFHREREIPRLGRRAPLGMTVRWMVAAAFRST